MTTPEPQASARTYVTEIWCPPADNGMHRLHLPMREPEPLPTPALEAHMTTPGPQAAAWVERDAILVASPDPAPEFEPAPACGEIRTPLELARLPLPDPEAGLGHDYDGPELRPGTPEYAALYAEYQAWAEPAPEPEAEP